MPVGVERMKRGFSLVEMAMVVAISGLMVGFLVQSSQNTNVNNECYAVTRAQLTTIRAAVDQFAHKNNRLPMPAARNIGVEDPNYGREALAASIVQAAGVSFGAVPFQALGLSPTFGSDCWGNKITYDVTTALTTSASSGGYLDGTVGGNITLESTTANTINTSTAYAIISHGEDGLGAVKANYTAGNGWCSGGTSLKYINCLANAATLADGVFNNGKNASANYFDDLIVTGGKELAVTVNTTPNLYCWGEDYGGMGILADGSTTFNHYYNTPHLSTSTVHFTQFVHSPTQANNSPCALATDGTAYCWGYNGTGAVGDGTSTSRSAPTAVNTTVKFSSIYALPENNDGGTITNCGIATSDSTAWCWGFGGNANNFIPGQTSAASVTSPVHVSTTLAFSKIVDNYTSEAACGLTTTNKIYCWGGLGSFAANTPTQNKATTTSTPVLVSGSHSFADIVGGSPMCALTNASDAAGAGKIFCWGAAGYDYSAAESTTSNWVYSGQPALAHGALGLLPITVTNITQGNPATVTYTTPASGLQLSPGDEVYIQGAGGMNCVNNAGPFTVYSGHYTATTFDLSTTRNSFTAFNTTSCAAYTSGGRISIVGRNAMTQLDNTSSLTFTKLLSNHSAIDSTGKLYSWGVNTGYTMGNGATNLYAYVNNSNASFTNPGIFTTAAAHGLVPGDQIYLFNVIYADSSAQGGTLAYIQLASSASSTDSTYNTQTVGITGGTGAGQSNTVYSYTGATRTATVSSAFTITPDNTSTYLVGTPVKAQTGGSSTTIKLNSSASATNSFYNGQTILITSGTGAGQVATVSAYVGSTKIATITGTWTTTPTNASYYLIGTPATAQSGGGNTVTLVSTSNATDNFYTGHTVTLTSGTGAGQTATITGYVGATKVATVSNWSYTVAPASGTKYEIDPIAAAWYTVNTTPSSTTFSILDNTGNPVDTSRAVPYNTSYGYGEWMKAPNDGSCYGEDPSRQLSYCSFTPTAATMTYSGTPFTFTDGSDGLGYLSVYIGPQGLYGWGGLWPFYAGMGNGNTGMTNYAVPQPVTTSGITYSSIAHGTANVCGVTTANDIYCWGYGQYHQFGSSTSYAYTPTKIGTQKLTTLINIGGVPISGQDDAYCGLAP